MVESMQSISTEIPNERSFGPFASINQFKKPVYLRHQSEFPLQYFTCHFCTESNICIVLTRYIYCIDYILRKLVMVFNSECAVTVYNSVLLQMLYG